MQPGYRDIEIRVGGRHVERAGSPLRALFRIPFDACRSDIVDRQRIRRCIHILVCIPTCPVPVNAGPALFTIPLFFGSTFLKEAGYNQVIRFVSGVAVCEPLQSPVP